MLGAIATPATKNGDYVVRILSLKSVSIAIVACSLLPPAASLASAQGFDLVSQARQYIGTNPTGHSRLWCGRFMHMVLQQTGRRGGGNLALGYLKYGPRTSHPVVGSIAVMGRKGGGHVGVVSGVDEKGNPIIISGNTWGGGSKQRRVMERAYPRSRIYAYVLPN